VYSPAGKRVVTAGGDGAVRVWAVDGFARDPWSGPTTSHSIAFYPKGERAPTAAWEGWIRIVECKTGRELKAWKGHAQSAVGIDWSSDGRFLVSTGNDGRVVLWNADNGELLRELEDLDGQILSAVFHPDATIVAAPGENGSIRAWSVPDGELLATLDGGASRAGYLRFDRDGSRLAAGFPDGSVRLWDFPARTLVKTLAGHPAGQVALCFDPTGERLLSASGRDVRAWKALDGELVAAFPAPAGGVLCLDWSRDGTRIAVGLANKNLEVWHAASGAVLLRRPYSSGVFFTRWSPDGGDLYAQPMDETVRVLRGNSRED
jgi:WD40 repeat protein